MFNTPLGLAWFFLVPVLVMAAAYDIFRRRRARRLDRDLRVTVVPPGLAATLIGLGAAAVSVCTWGVTNFLWAPLLAVQALRIVYFRPRPLRIPALPIARARQTLRCSI